MGMGEFNSDDHYIYYCGQESLRRNGVALIINNNNNKNLKCNTWVQSQKQQRDLGSFPRQTIQHTVIQSNASTTDAKEPEVQQFDEDLQDLLKLTPPKDVLFIIGDWNAKVESQEIPEVIGKFGLEVQNEAGQRLTEFCQKNTLVITNTLFQQHRRQLYT